MRILVLIAGMLALCWAGSAAESKALKKASLAATEQLFADPKVLEISVEARHLGNTSFTLFAEFRIAGRENVIATVETVYVHVDHKTLQKQVIPDLRREALQRGAPGVAIDHAGYLR